MERVRPGFPGSRVVDPGTECAAVPVQVTASIGCARLPFLTREAYVPSSSLQPPVHVRVARVWPRAAARFRAFRLFLLSVVAALARFVFVATRSAASPLPISSSLSILPVFRLPPGLNPKCTLPAPFFTPFFFFSVALLRGLPGPCFVWQRMTDICMRPHVGSTAANGFIRGGVLKRLEINRRCCNELEPVRANLFLQGQVNTLAFERDKRAIYFFILF